jgi:BASS family bile acid:Na+ symporter
MDDRQGLLARLARFLHRHFLMLLFVSYAAAALWPRPGLAVRHCSLGRVGPGAGRIDVSLPVLMLAFLLFNAGLGVQARQLRGLLHRPRVLVAGLAANLAFPIAFILAVTWGMRLWHNPDEVQNILVGLALVAAMPIAGSSTAWSQNTDGDLALSLGLVLGSTFLSPVMTPLALHAVGWMASGDYAGVLHGLASGGTGAFLAIGVIVPSLSGIGLRLAAGPSRIEAAKPILKVVNSLILLALNYANAAVSLPQAIAEPDLDFLSVTLGLVAGLCILAFAAGWTVACLIGAGRDQRVSLMFALGMNNNGTGLVLASMALARYPRVMLPIIFYNMIQHLVAGAVNALVDRPAPPPVAATPPPGRTREAFSNRALVPGRGGRTRTAGCPDLAIEHA